MRDGCRGYQHLDGAAFHLVGVYVRRILKSEKVADLPVQQSMKVALALNLKTAKTLGIHSLRRCRSVPSKSANVAYWQHSTAVATIIKYVRC